MTPFFGAPSTRRRQAHGAPTLNNESPAAGPSQTGYADFLVVGGGIAGFTAAQTLRNEGAQGSILMLCAENEYPYNRPPLTKGYLTGQTPRELLLLAPPERYRDEGIGIRLGCRARSIDPAAHSVRDESGGTYRYGKLLIATGAHARRLESPGEDLPGTFTLRSLADATALRDWVSAHPGPIAIIGASFIAMELATSFTQMGLEVTLLERAGTVFPRIHSPTLSSYFLERCRSRGIKVLLNQSIRKIRGTRRVTGIESDAGETVACRTVVMAVGTTVETGCLAGSGLAVGDGILVDEFLQASHPDVFAAGDVASYPDGQGTRQRSMHWENARRQGQLAAKNMLGQRIPYASVLHYYCAFLDFSFTFLGSSDEADRRISRGSLAKRSFAEFYVRAGRVTGLFSTGRPPEETRVVETLIRDRIAIHSAQAQLADPAARLDDLARGTILILQGGAALGAFECGVIRAMDEARVVPGVVGGVSIGAINGAIVAGNPGCAVTAIEAFWDEIAVRFPLPTPESVSSSLALGTISLWGLPDFFRPRWLTPGMQGEWWPAQWTSVYDMRPLRDLLTRYVDFDALPASPIRLIVSAVDVERGELVFFDSRTDTLTPDHILASGSLPPMFPWTTIDGRHYWDGGIISNSPLEHVLQQCGADNKQVFIVDLFPGERPLPSNLAEVLSRRDEIIYGERIRNDAHARELIQDFKSLVQEVMAAVDPDTAARLRQRPRYVHLMGRGATTTITRISRDGSEREPLAAHYDFSAQAIGRQRKEGYLTALRLLAALERTSAQADAPDPPAPPNRTDETP